MIPRLQFRHRISLLVVLATLALAIVTSVALVLGSRVEVQLTGIETRYVPLIELNADLERLFAATTRALEDAASAGEPSKLDEADRLSAEFLERLSRGERAVIDNGADPSALAALFRDYYTIAREVSAELAAGQPFGLLGSAIETMTKQQQELVRQLALATSPNRSRLSAAFAAARKSQQTALRIDILVACVAFFVMVVLSWRIIRGMVTSLQAVSDGMERLARGDFSQPIEVPPGDEIADLAREANRTAARLQKYRQASDREAWIKTGLAELGDQIAGELPLATLGRNAMTHLAAYAGADAAAIFAGDEDGKFELLAASDGTELLPKAFHREDASPLGDIVRASEVRVISAATLAHANVSLEIAVPLVHEDRVLGALLLGMRAEPDSRTLDLLGRARATLGIAFRVAQSREHVNALLLETQRQALAAETANKELESFSYSVSHDLRAPLRGIDGFSQALLEDEGDRLSPEGHSYLRRIRAAAQRMAELIDDLLRLSRVSRGDFRKSQIDLSAIATAIVADLRRAQPERTADVVIQEDVTAFADARLIRVALENLLGNAWKFTSKVDRARIEFGTRKDDSGQLVYFVRDNGAGFDMKYAERLFGAFQRLHAEKDFPGTGIGLATVQRILLRHGGHIWVDAAVGQGATFQFTLPADEGESAVRESG